ncbi:MAG: carbohydrate binding domain-containing protein [Planctomycetes bacterium]|jgi:hypothetical protein|nr:carbohydrate binding domain-containing protein [Planctomycetota bacterium]
MKTHLRNMVVVALILAAVVSRCPAQERDMVRNGDFEQDSDGNGMADSWQFSGDQGVVVSWARDPGFTGQFSQKLQCTAFAGTSSASHAMLCQMNTLRLEKGRWYQISFAAKEQGIPGGGIHVAISDTQTWQNCGLSESFRARSAWRQFEFVFQATQTISDHTRLQFWYTSTGTFWLDSVRLVPSAPVPERFTEVLPPTGAVNLLRNSSFECGTGGWGSIADTPGWGGNLDMLVGSVDTTVGRFHGSSFKIALTPETIPVFYFDYFPLYREPVKAPLLANQGWVSVQPDTSYTLSAYLKADADGLAGVLSIPQASRGTLRKQVSLTTSWQRYSFAFRPQSPQVFVALGLDLEASQREAGTIWIDGVQLEKGTEATGYQPRAAVEAGIESTPAGNLFSADREPQMSARVFNAGESSRSVGLHLSTTDFDDATVHDNSVSINVGPSEHVTVALGTGVMRKGFYRLRVESPEAEVALTRPLRFAIVAPYPHADSLFGMNHAYPWPHLLDLSKQIGLGWFRDWSLKWHDVEPQQGRFEFTEPDRQIDRVLDRGLKVIALLPFPSALWSSSAAPEVGTTDRYPGSRQRIAYMPRDLNAFATYVRQTVQHYRGRLTIWEILNEPIYTDYSLPRAYGYQVADYIRLLTVAYQAVKEVDPNALVIGGIAGGPSTYTQEFIDAGGLRFVDALNLHIYPGLTAPEAYEEPLRRLREKMNATRLTRPIWFTEGAYYADDDRAREPFRSSWLKPLESEAEAAEWQVKFNTLLLTYGVERIIYHAGTAGRLNQEDLGGIFFEWAGAPRKMLVTQAALANLLVPPVRPRGRLQAPEGIAAYGFETPGRTILVAWAPDVGANNHSPLQIDENWKAVDLQGNLLNVQNVTLTERPIYLVSEGPVPAPLPWP